MNGLVLNVIEAWTWLSEYAARNAKRPGKGYRQKYHRRVWALVDAHVAAQKGSRTPMSDDGG